MGNRNSTDILHDGISHVDDESKPSCGAKCIARCDMKLRRQTNALWTPFAFLFASALHLGFGLINPRVVDLDWAKNATNLEASLTIMVFFFGVILGSLIAPVLLAKLRKKFIYLLCSFLYIPSAILCIALSNYYYTILIARLLIGFGHGIVDIVGLIHASEVAEPDKRGRLIADIQLNQMMSIFQMRFLMTSAFEFLPISSVPLLGCITLVLSILGSIFNFLLGCESPYFEIQRGNDEEALELLMHLRYEKRLTPGTQEEFHEIKKMVDEDRMRSPSRSIFQDGNLKPLIIALLSTLIFTISYNYPVNTLRFVKMSELYGMQNASFIFINVRIVFFIPCMLLANIIPRKVFFTIGAIAMSIGLLSFGIMSLFKDSMPIAFSIVFYIIYECIGTNGLWAATGLIVTEIFTTTKKPLSLAFINVIIASLNTIYIAWMFDAKITQSSIFVFLFAPSIIVIIFLVVVLKLLPNTTKKSLKEARAMFWKLSDTPLNKSTSRSSIPSNGVVSLRSTRSSMNKGKSNSLGNELNSHHDESSSYA